MNGYLDIDPYFRNKGVVEAVDALVIVTVNKFDRSRYRL